MNISVRINSCLDCRHRDHSGAFTPGGAIPICQHPHHPKNAEVPGVCDFNDVKTKEIAQKIFAPRTLEKGVIPSWCPLKMGLPY